MTIEASIRCRKYRDHVREGRDFPVRQSSVRDTVRSELRPIGYGKALMLFHMPCAVTLGDDVFRSGCSPVFYLEERE